MNSFRNLGILFLAISLSNCASVTRGTMDALVVESTPGQADVKITRTNAALTSKELSSNPNDGQAIIGKTPASFKLKRKGEYDVQVSKPGYKTATIRVTHRTSGAGGTALAGNVLVGGVVGLATDAVTGATQDLTPNPVTVRLERR